MCVSDLFTPDTPAQQPVAPAPSAAPTVEDPAKPMVTPDQLKRKETTGANRAASRRPLRLDVGSGGDTSSGLGLPV